MVEAMVQAPKKAPRDGAKRAKLWPCGDGQDQAPLCQKPEVEDVWIDPICLLNHGNDLFDLDLIYMYFDIWICLSIYWNLFILLSIYKDLNINIDSYIYIHMFIYLYIYISIYLSIYLSYLSRLLQTEVNHNIADLGRSILRMSNGLVI